MLAAAAVSGSSIRERVAEHDLRLAFGAVTAWVAAALALSEGLRWAVPLAVAAALCGLAGLGLRRRGRAVGAVLALSAFCVVLVLGPLSARLFVNGSSTLAQLAQQRVDVSAEVTLTGDPHPLAASGGNGSAREIVAATVDRVYVGGRLVRASGSVVILGPAGLWPDALPGQRLRIDAAVRPPLAGDLLTATLIADSRPVLIGRPPWWQRAAGTIRTSLRAATAGLPSEVAGLLPGLIDGDTTQLDPVLAEHFRVAGLTHLVAVSGTNCSIVTGVVLLILRRARIGPRGGAIVGAFALVAFVLVARPSPSVLRAAVMAAVALWCLATGRERVAVPALAATVLVLLIWQPGLAADAGFLMSALATASLLLIAPGWADALRRRHVPPVVAEALAVAAAANVLTAPVIAAISGRISVVAIPANLLAEPVVAIVTVVGFAAALVAPVYLPGGALLAQVAGWPCRWLIGVANFFGGRPGATLPWPSGTVGGLALLLVLLALFAVLRRAGPRRMVAVFVVVSVVVLIPGRAVVSGWPAAGWVFVACDVGQGDGLVLPAGEHTAVVIDSGPDPVAMDRCLSSLQITDVALLVFTHYHLDHVGGIVGVFHGRTVHQVVTGPLSEPAGGVSLVHSVLTAHHLTIGAAPIGTTVDVGAVRLDFLAPLAPFRGTRSDPNNSSVIIRATVRGVRILLPGDAEIAAQQSVLESGADLRADVLKVPHHGSAYSDPGFLAAVDAKVAVISVGAGNDYGLPAPSLLRELDQLGLPMCRTDRDGDVAVVESGGVLSTVSRGVTASTVG